MCSDKTISQVVANGSTDELFRTLRIKHRATKVRHKSYTSFLFEDLNYKDLGKYSIFPIRVSPGVSADNFYSNDPLWFYSPYKRLKSFTELGGSQVFLNKLHDQGFYYEKFEDLLRCHRCGFQFPLIDIQNEISKKHYPNCYFARFQQYPFDDPLSSVAKRSVPKDSILSKTPARRFPKDTKTSYKCSEKENINAKIQRSSEKCIDLEGNQNLSHRNNDIIGVDCEILIKERPTKDKESRPVCLRCKNSSIDMLFKNCFHSVTCRKCSLCVDFCLVCDKRIVDRIDISNFEQSSCYRCNEKTAEVILCSCWHLILCEKCSECLDFCPLCDIKITARHLVHKGCDQKENNGCYQKDKDF